MDDVLRTSLHRLEPATGCLGELDVHFGETFRWHFQSERLGPCCACLDRVRNQDYAWRYRLCLTSGSPVRTGGETNSEPLLAAQLGEESRAAVSTTKTQGACAFRSTLEGCPS